MRAAVHGIVHYFRPFQDASGRIIDQYAKIEIQYSTPCYAFAAAALVARRGEAELLQSAVAAWGIAAFDLANASCAQGHCNFYVLPLMFAYRLLAPLVNESTVASWNATLARIDPYVSYHGYMARLLRATGPHV